MLKAKSAAILGPLPRLHRLQTFYAARLVRRWAQASLVVAAVIAAGLAGLLLWPSVPAQAQDDVPAVDNLHCIARADVVAFFWDAPEWSGGEAISYDYELTLPDGGREGGNLKDITSVIRWDTYQSGQVARFSVTANYQTSDSRNVTGAEATLTCYVGGARPLVITPNSATRQYGGIDDLGYTVSGLVDGDAAGDVLSGSLGRSPGDDVGTYAINLGTLAIAPAYATKYALPDRLPATTYVITPKPATYTGTAPSKAYDGTTIVSGPLSGSFAAGDIIDGDTVTVGRGTYAQLDAGTGIAIEWIYASGADAGNYAVTFNVSGDITPLAITAVSGVRVNARVADGTTTATFDTSTAQGAGVLARELADFRAGGLHVRGSFSAATPGTHDVSATYSLQDSGSFKAGNYALSPSAATATLRGEIQALTEITAISGVRVKARPADGTTTATFDTSTAQGAGVLARELADFRAGGLVVNGEFPSAEPGSYDLRVTYSLRDSGSFKAVNYALSPSAATATLRGEIQAQAGRPVVADCQPAAGGDYDADDDGLIEVCSLAQLDAVRFDLDGDGSSSAAGYAAAFSNAAIGMGCPMSGCVGYELTAELDFDTNGSGGGDSGDDYWNNGHGWLPIGTDTDGFSAIFEGNGEVISNLYIDSDPGKHSAATSYHRKPGPIGLFQEICAGGVVRNLGLEDVDVSRVYPCYDKCGDGHLGALAGVNHGKISGSRVTGVVSNSATYAYKVHDWDTYYPVRPTDLSVRAGGLVGLAGSSSVIANSYSAARVSTLSDWPSEVGNEAGGLVGHNSGSITASYATGNVSSSPFPSSENEMMKKIAEKVINVGGLVGLNSGPITASYSTGAVSGGLKGHGAGGLVGRARGNATVSDSYFDTVASGQSSSAGGVGKTTAELQATTETSSQQNYTPYTGIYANWNVDLNQDNNSDDPWDFGTSSQYPALSGLGVPKQRGHTPVQVPVIDYDSDDDGLIEISTPYQLYALHRDRNGDGSLSYPDEYNLAYNAIEYLIAFPGSPDGMGCPQTGCVGYELLTDLELHDMDPTYHYSMATAKDGYAAIFEGNGHTISNFRDKGGMSFWAYGLFNVVSADGIIRNLRMTSVGSGGWHWAGAVAGINYGTISNVHVSGYVVGVSANDTGVGGLVGLNKATGVITDSSSAGRAVGSIDGTGGRYVGGLVGRNEGSIRSSYSTANAYAIETDDMGGLVGYNAASGSIRASYATGDVWHGNWEKFVPHYWDEPPSRYLGGLVGTNQGEITASYSTGRASGGKNMNAESLGGLVGRNDGGTVTVSYWDTQTSGWATSAAGVGKTTAALQQPTGYTGIYAGWNLDLDGDDSGDDPWNFGTSSQYPVLSSPGAARQPARMPSIPDKAYSISSQASAVEGQATTLTITLSQAAPEGGVEFSVTSGYSGDATATADDGGAVASPVTVAQGNTTLDITIPTVADAVDEDDETFTVTVAANTAGWEKAGDGRDTATVIIADDDTAGVTVNAANPLSVAEGGSASYTVVLDSRPTANVTVSASSSDVGAATVSPASHTFTPSGWNIPLTFKVRGVADADPNDEQVAVSHGATGADARYAALLLSTVAVAVADTTADSPQGDQSPRAKYADLIAEVKEWRNDSRYVHDKAHTDRWDRVLLTFGETVADTTLAIMTEAEAQTYVNRGWTRWIEVTQALRELENRAPTVADAIADATIVNESGTLEVSLSGVFSDADNDPLTITAVSSDQAVATALAAPDHSTVTVNAHARGTATVTVTADDRTGGTVSDTFTVTVKAAPVVAQPLADVSGLEVDATQDVSLSGVFHDADGDSLTITATPSNETKATVTVASDGSKLTVAGVAEGTATITVTAQDADGNRVSDTFDAPVARKYAGLIARVYEWRNDSRYVHDKAHTDRWDRVLLTFGETVADTTLTVMPAAEAQGHADRGWERWEPVAEALREIEAG